MAKKPKLTLKERELAFCLGRLEQYWLLINDKIHKRKLKGTRSKLICDKLCDWEIMIYEMLDETP
jgi:hypothetical protein